MNVLMARLTGKRGGPSPDSSERLDVAAHAFIRVLDASAESDD